MINNNATQGIVLVVALLMMFPIFAADTVPNKEECNGPYQLKTLSPQTISNVIEQHYLYLKNSDPRSKIYYEIKHKKWLEILNDNKLPKPTKQTAQRANLCFAYLENANFHGADLSEANLQGASLVQVNLEDADLYEANLENADLYKANLQSADLNYAHLQSAILDGANLQSAGLEEANLQGADLRNANLQGADLVGANLTKAELLGSDLSQSNLKGANFQQAMLLETELKNANMINVNLTESVFMPVSAPDSGSMANIKGLLTVKLETNDGYNNTSEANLSGMVMLRNGFKEGGLRNLEREATYVIERWKTEHTASSIEKWFNCVFLEVTTGYGLYYGRPIWIIIVLWFIFALIYIAPVASGSNMDSGIFRSWPDGEKSENISETKDLKILATAFYFSLLSAFHFGWKDLNVGTWISRVHPKDYTLRAKGWVKSVSGIQSLISVYMLAMWALTYFGRPFQ